MTVQELMELRAQKGKAMRALHETCKAENRDWSTDDQARWDALEKEIAGIDADIERQKRIDALEAIDVVSDGINEDADRRNRDHAGNDDDRPLSARERTQAMRYWIAGTRAVYRGQEEDQRCYERSLHSANRIPTREDGVALNGATALNLCLNRGFSPSGEPFEAPRTITEARQQAQARRSMTAEQRATLITGTASLGGNTIPDEMMLAIDVALLAMTPMRALATIQPTGTGADLPIPTVNDTANNGRWLAENTVVTETEPAFGQIVMNAHKASADMIPVSLELLQDNAVNLPALIGRLAFERIGRLSNAGYTVGDNSGKPNGIVTAAASSGITGAITYDNMIDLCHSVDISYRANAGYMLHDNNVAALRKLKSTDGVPLWSQSVVAGEPDRFNNFPVHINNDMPIGSSAKGVLFGDISKYMIRDVLDFTLIRLDERYMDQLRVAFLAVMRTDGDLIDAGTNPVKFMTLPA